MIIYQNEFKSTLFVCCVVTYICVNFFSPPYIFLLHHEKKFFNMILLIITQHKNDHVQHNTKMIATLL